MATMGYGTKDVARLLGLEASEVRAFVRAGFIEPGRDAAGEERFGFQDLVLLRTLKRLTAAKISPKRIRRVLETLRAELPRDRPLSAVALDVEGPEVVVRDEEGRWNPESRQALFDFDRDFDREPDEIPEPDEIREPAEVADPGAEPVRVPDPAEDAPAERAHLAEDAAAEVAAPAALAPPQLASVTPFAAPPSLRPLASQRPAKVIDLASSRPRPARSAKTPLGPDAGPGAWIDLGIELEATAPTDAEEAYRRALALDPTSTTARVNLGRLRHDDGDLDGAEREYRLAAEAHPEDPVPSFNLGVVLEDQGRLRDAAAAYERAIAADARYSDAYFNLGHLYEALGNPVLALRCLRTYRKLTGR